MSEETAAAASTDGNTATSNHMATLVPTFDPAKDDLEQYAQEVELLSEIWPGGKLNELITRLIFNTNGTAFQKLQLNKAQLMTNDKKGVQLLVTLLGGQWGKVNLEKKYDIVERALFRCIQKPDESNDSFLARCDIVWSELLAKQVKLDEIQSYIILRGSRLSTDDKKRVIIESESSSSGVLNMERVNQSVHMLGTSFFNEMIGQKANKGKIYESQTMLAEECDDFQHHGDLRM